MAKLFTEGCDRPGYRGISSIFEYINDDGELFRTNCGQAAAATFLTHYGRFKPLAAQAATIMNLLEKDFPPDNFFGLLGTSRRRVEMICRARGVPLRPIAGRAALCSHLLAGQPAIVMLAVPGGHLWKWDLPGGHWMVASGFDADCIYLTNCGRMPWSEFEAGWCKMVPRLINMHNKALVAR